MRGRQSWLGRHDSTLRPNPQLFLHTVVVMMEMVSKTLIERERERDRKCEVLLLRRPGKSGCIGSV